MIRPVAIGLCIATLLLIVWGGAVHATGSGLACGDQWPLCHEVARAARGEPVLPTLMPRMVGGVAVEHGHRVFAALVGLGTIAFVFLAFRRPDRRLRAWALVALGLVIAQGLLGALTVRLRLPGIVSTGHLCLSMAFLGTMIFLANRTRPPGRTAGLPRTAAVISFVLVCAEIFLGAVVRHTGAGPVCAAQFPMCNGQWIPDGAQGLTQLAHRVLALVVLGAVVWGAARAARTAREGGRPGARLLALAAPCLAAVQVGLGVATVLTGIQPVMAVLHLGVGALFFVDQLALVLSLGPAAAPAAVGAVTEPAPIPALGASA
ncbi:MAG: COX15/CtaA family protein [Deltaproteobacteria bacterium]|nr:COX15/CtaA family protein [Deltaproteobacteria bacterium]